MVREIIAIPMGIAAGIGQEITVKSLAKEELYNMSKPLVVGDAKIISKATEVTSVSLQVSIVASPAEGAYEFGTIDVLDLANIDMDTFKPGQVETQNGKAAFEYIKCSIELAMAGEVKALATTPMNKESLKAVNVPYIGHTDISCESKYTNEKKSVYMIT